MKIAKTELDQSMTGRELELVDAVELEGQAFGFNADGSISLEREPHASSIPVFQGNQEGYSKVLGRCTDRAKHNTGRDNTQLIIGSVGRCDHA